jgi:glycosyltransferase involved in cell wall biosynthesis
LAVVPGPQVTIVIPTRNRWELLSRHALPSALGQEHVDVEVVVADDASTDGTAERLAALRDERVRLGRPESRGQAHARNAGIADARGEWIAFLDDDDVWSPRKLRAQLDTAEATGAVWAYAPMLVLDEGLRVIDVVPAPEPSEVGRLLRMRNALAAGSSTVIARADVARDLGGFDTDLNELVDWDFWLRLAGAGPAAAAREPLVGYVRHPRQLRLTGDGDVQREFRHFAAKHGLEGMDLYFSRWVAMGHLRAGRRLRAAATYLRSGLAHRSLGNVVRAGAALVGERAFELRRRLVADRTEPEWLERYR